MKNTVNGLKRNTCLVIVGPTASGKSALAVELALQFNGEIISADSMQIYKGFDIGTAKPSAEEMKSVPHYLIDTVSPLEEYSAAQFQKDASGYIDEITSRGKLPIIVGGTGLYINSLIYNIEYSEAKADDDIRRRLNDEYNKYGKEYLYGKLKQIDPNAAVNIHVNNVKRVIRALEVYEITGERFSEHVERSRLRPPEYDFIIIGLNPERSYMYERIDKRVDEMIENGLVDEVKSLNNTGMLEGKTSSAGIGYKEIKEYLIGEISLETAIEKIKLGTRHYAKRQMTWFRKTENVNWIDVYPYTTLENVIDLSKNIIVSHIA